MKIGQSPEPASGVPAPAPKRPPAQDANAAGQARGAAMQPTQASSVSMSTLARTLELSRRTSDAGEVDQKRVDEIRAAIADGSYQVDAGAIADKMLSHAEELLDPRQRAS